MKPQYQIEYLTLKTTKGIPDQLDETDEEDVEVDP